MKTTCEVRAKEIAEALGCSKRTILRKAKKQAWPYRKGAKRARWYRIQDLPYDIQKVLAVLMDVPTHLLPPPPPGTALSASLNMGEINQVLRAALRVGIQNLDELAREINKQKQRRLLLLKELEAEV